MASLFSNSTQTVYKSNMEALIERARLSSPVVWVTAAVVMVAALHRLLVKPRDSREPPYVDSTIPLLGHLLGLYSKGAAYFTYLDQEHKQGIYTLPIPLKPMYVAASPEWSTAIQKHSSTIDLYTLSARALTQLMGLNKESMEIVEHHLHGDKRTTSDNIIYALKDTMVKSLAGGEHLDELNNGLLKNLEPLFNNLANNGKPQKMQLWAWARQKISEVSMAAAYGTDNPVSRDPGLVEDFWTFDATAAALMMPFPQLFAPKGHNARWRFINGFIDYAVRGGHNAASGLIRARAKAALAYEIAIDQYGQLESNFAPGLLSNTVPGTFWLISRIFEDPELLAEIRKEIDACVSVAKGNKHVINVLQLQTQCPLFNSAFLETLRTVSPLNTYRYIREDTVITNNTTKQSYLLKKDNLIQLASTVLHSRESVWGAKPEDFQADRFIPVVNRARANGGLDGKPMDPAAPFRDPSGKMHSGSFRPFGGGVHLCPGRFFAQTGILAGAAMWISMFDMESEPGKYVPPKFADAKGFMFLSIIKPASDVEVTLTRRKGYENIDWEFDTSN